MLEEPVLFPELLLETTEMALAIASTADRRSANVFLSDLSASEMKMKKSQQKVFKLIDVPRLQKFLHDFFLHFTLTVVVK